MAVETLTVVVTDIVRSTETLAAVEAHDGDRVLARHFALLRTQLARNSGHEVKTTGDGVIATFRSATSAIEAAVAMQQAVTRDRGAHPAGPLSIRVGIGSGDVRVVDGDCYGLPVVVASRLCSYATGGQILLTESTRLLVRDHMSMVEVGALELKGLREPTRTWAMPWLPEGDRAVRVVVADDAALVREGVAHILEAAGMQVIGQAGDPDELMRLIADLGPDLAIVDIRMPPTHTMEGLNAATQIKVKYPATGVLMLSMEIEPRYAARLLRASPTGVGYLLKESVGDVHEFTDAARRVATGGTAFAPALTARLENLGSGAAS